MQLREMTAEPVGHPIRPNELIDPIRFLRTEHVEQRAFCHRLDKLLEEPGREESPTEASLLLDFLFGEMALNMRAEEKALAPLLSERCLPEDRLDAVLDDTWKAHSLIALLLPDIGHGLACLSDGEPPKKPLDFIFKSLEMIDAVQRHLDREDLLLLALAEFRLTTEDYVLLGHALASQHGLQYPIPETRPGNPIDTPAIGIGESWRRTAWRHQKAELFDKLH